MCNRFAMFPAHLLRAGLTLREQSVLLCLLSYRNGDGQAWPYRATIADDTGIKVRHVHDAVRSLAGKGIIRCETQPGVRTVYTFPCLDAQPEQPAETPAPAPVVAKNATAAETAPKPVPEPKPEPVPVQESTPEPAPAPAQPTDDNPSQVAEPEQRPAPAPAPAPEPKPAPVVAPVATQEQKPAPAPVATQKPAPMPALEPAPPAPRRAIVSARVARLPDVDEAVRREVDARPVIKSSGEKEVDPELKERARKLAALCAENTARSRERKAAAQRFEDGVTAATEQVAKQRAAQDIAAARQRAAQNAAAAKPEELAAKTEELDGKHEELPVETVAQPAPEPVATAPVVVPVPVPVVVPESPEPAPQQALPIICEPQTPAATPQQGELLPAEPKSERTKRATRLPEDWQLPRSWGIWAMERFGFTEDQVRYQADKFRDHWTSTTRNPAKKDWFGTWRNWMRTANERGERFDYNSRPDQQKSKMTQALDNLANMKLDWEHQETWNPFAPPTPEETEAARKREEARAAARIAEASRMHEAANLIYVKRYN